MRASNKPAQKPDCTRLRHLAFIMDGNGRWAKKRGLPREFGHKAGAKTFREVAQYCADIGIEFVTVYVFSTENWKRPEEEIRGIIGLLHDYLDEFIRDYDKYNTHVVMVGDLSVFDSDIRAKIDKLDKLTENKPLRLNIALNYGSRDELAHAFTKLAAEGKTTVTEKEINEALYTADCPDPDMIVRTGGDMRISNFLLWQSAYSELYFTKTLWPDMKPSEIDEIVREYNQRQRRYGGL